MTGRRLLVKVCGQTSAQGARLCVFLGADMLGFIFHAGSPRCVTPDLPASLGLPGVLKAGVFVAQSPDEVLAVMEAGRLDIAQLHGNQDTRFCRTIADAIGPERVMKVLWPERAASLEDFQSQLDLFAPFCGRFLADAGKSGGGHGRAISDEAADMLAAASFPRPWLLAGGLGPGNIAPTLARFGAAGCRPAGIDLNSGVESAPGVKDETLLRQAFAEIESLCAAQNM
ncbi:MAG: phosphoribosylanthranilate isomerase [Desulfovibrio sp.]|jgi:phosphoribosylanthranilate isomerase|nr:phosphoribosylanthranilate isomerase [Desulfovibrio sp.]